MENIHIKKLHPDAIIPTRAHSTDAGLDLYANEDAQIYTSVVIPTGIAIDIPPGYVGLIWPRSGLSAKHGIDVLAGVVDAGYQGEIKVCLAYGREHPAMYDIKKGDKIAQILIQKIETPMPFLVEEFIAPTERGEKGFGSTDKPIDGFNKEEVAQAFSVHSEQVQPVYMGIDLAKGGELTITESGITGEAGIRHDSPNANEFKGASGAGVSGHFGGVGGGQGGI